jgi:hypothetical protein
MCWDEILAERTVVSAAHWPCSEGWMLFADWAFVPEHGEIDPTSQTCTCTCLFQIKNFFVCVCAYECREGGSSVCLRIWIWIWMASTLSLEVLVGWILFTDHWMLHVGRLPDEDADVENWILPAGAEGKHLVHGSAFSWQGPSRSGTGTLSGNVVQLISRICRSFNSVFL